MTNITGKSKITVTMMEEAFRVQNDLRNGQFKHIQCTADEHILIIDRLIRILKEIVFVFATTMPFERYLPSIIVKMTYSFIFWLNSLQIMMD